MEPILKWIGENLGESHPAFLVASLLVAVTWLLTLLMNFVSFFNKTRLQKQILRDFEGAGTAKENVKNLEDIAAGLLSTAESIDENRDAVRNDLRDYSERLHRVSKYFHDRFVDVAESAGKRLDNLGKISVIFSSLIVLFFIPAFFWSNTASNQIAALVQQTDQQASQLDETNRELSDASRQIASLENDVASARERLQAQQSDLEGAERRLDEISRAANDLASGVPGAEDRLNDLLRGDPDGPDSTEPDEVQVDPTGALQLPLRADPARTRLLIDGSGSMASRFQTETFLRLLMQINSRYPEVRIDVVIDGQTISVDANQPLSSTITPRGGDIPIDLLLQIAEDVELLLVMTDESGSSDFPLLLRQVGQFDNGFLIFSTE